MNALVNRRLGALIAVLLGLAGAGHVRADARTKAAQEAAEYVLQRFGRQAVREGAESLARKIETYSVRHGDDFIKAIRQVGPRAFHLVEEAGVHGEQAVRVLARHGEAGAVWVVSRPKAMQMYVKHGEEAAAALVKHTGIAEPVIEQFGQPAVKFLQAANVQNGRRLAMMLEGGELAKIGRSRELLEVIGSYGDRAMTFVWEHKGALATTAGLTAFLANPDSFISGARDIAQIVGENVIKPVAQMPGAVATEIARGTNWTLLFLAAGATGFLCVAAKSGLLNRLLARTQARRSSLDGYRPQMDATAKQRTSKPGSDTEAN
jgi:predicted Fe-Mo cluster-binding NifX family protein